MYPTFSLGFSVGFHILFLIFFMQWESRNLSITRNRRYARHGTSTGLEMCFHLCSKHVSKIERSL